MFAALPLVYTLLYGSNGFADTDGGFIPGLAWRVLNGQLPYLDFVYVRPPLTPMLHALELWIWPDRWELIGMRLDYYLMLWGAVAFGMQALRRQIDFEGMGIAPWLLASIAFMLGVHNFPATAWHTVDGIFFGAMGFWLLSGRTSVLVQALGLLALALSGLAKQPFFILLPAGLVLLPLLQPRRVAIFASLLGLGTLGGLSALTILLLPHGFTAAMMDQVLGAGEGEVLLQTGVLNYGLPAVMAGAALGLVVLTKGRDGLGRILGMAFQVGLLALPLLYVALQFRRMEFVPPVWGTFHALLLLAWAAAAMIWRTGNRHGAVVLFALGLLSWASGLSWGYAMPVLFALPGVVGVAWWAHRASGGRWFSWRLLTVSVFVACLLWQLFPYRDVPVWQQVGGAGEIFPKLGHVRTNPQNLAKWRELAELDSVLQGRYAVVPAQPGVHWLTGSQPLLPTDWEHDAEVGNKPIPALEERARNLNLAIVVEMERIPEADAADLHYRSSLLKAFLDDEKWPVAIQGTWFQVRLPRPLNP